MKYIASTISEFIISEIDKLLKDYNKVAREIRIILPSLPAEVVLQIGKDLDEFRLDQDSYGKKIKLIYKCAYALGHEWRTSDDIKLRMMFSEIVEKGWYDTENHLTQWRNVLCEQGKEDLLATVLVGYDRVVDQSSLADFFRLDFQTLWKSVLKKRFNKWIEERLKEKPLEYENEHVERMNEILRALVDESIADLNSVSNFLEQLDLTNATYGRDALTEMVRQLDYFKLPRMSGLSSQKSKRRKSVAHYLKHAIEFFNYGKFINRSARKKALKSIDVFERNCRVEDLDLNKLGSYKIENDYAAQESLEAFVGGLRRYIETNDIKEREKIRSVDFIFLLDEVLGARESKSPKRPKRPKKLSGYPLEVVLRALWLTMREFKSWAIDNRLIALEKITDILIHGDTFKHDCSGEDKEEERQNANRFLHQLIGGLDNYLERQLSFYPDRINDPERTVDVKSCLCPSLEENTLSYERTKTGEPHLKFTITIAAGSHAVKRQFIWRIPQYHSYRTMVDMFEWFNKQIDSQGLQNPVPIFCVPHFDELMLSKDEEEVNRLLQKAMSDSTSSRLLNLLEAPNIDKSDKLFSYMKKLGHEYTRFVIEAHNKGIFAALEDYITLESVFKETYDTYLYDPECSHSSMGALLFKAFCVIDERSESQGQYWMWHEYEPSFIITPLHPALIEMLYHQHAFLCESFVKGVQLGLRESGTKWFNENKWTDIEDLAKIQWPVQGTLKGPEKILDTNLRSFGLIHLVGERPVQEATLTTRLLLRYDSEEDEEITDEELFRATRESRLIQRILSDYRSLTPHADDGLAIAAYCGGTIQPLISGIHGFLGQLFTAREAGKPYTISLTLFAESQDDTTILRWVREWRERWETPEPSSKMSYYKDCRISVAHRVVSKERDYAQLFGLLASIDVDITFLFHFIRAGESGNQFVKVEAYDHRRSFRMFPVMEKISCSIIGGGHEFTRERITSNRQFKLGTLHSGVMARLKNMSIPEAGKYEYVVVGRGDFSPWMKIVDEFHRRSAWVVCIDPIVDEYLIAKEDNQGKREREIIGFGSGVGAHGEYNYTVSTEEYSLARVKQKISANVSAKLGPWDQETCDQIASSIISEVRHMAGMSLVKATGPSEYVRDFIAYALVRKLLPSDPEAFCDEVISLDAFMHWFDSTPSEKRPDLLHLKAKMEDGIFKVTARLIECKLAQESERHLEKAREQLEAGLSHLISCFKPREEEDIPEGFDERPDQRYWWLQLHRLLASKARIYSQERGTTVTALEKLSDGMFNIEWSAAAVTFWADSDRVDIHKESDWEFQYEGFPLPIQVISAGRNFVRALCTGESQDTLPIDPSLSISFSPYHKDAPSEFEEIESVKETLAKETMEKAQPVSVESANIPDRVFLGKGVMAGTKLYWEFGHKELSNRHILIFGTSGMGKTYTIQALLCELARQGQNSLIVDYTDGFHENQLERETLELLKPKQHIVKVSKVPINPFRRQQTFLSGESIPESAFETAQRVTGVFSEVYGLGDQQKAALYTAIKRGIELFGDEMNLSHIPQLLSDCASDGTAVSSAATSVISKIRPFIDINPFGQEDPETWEKLFTDAKNRCHILQLAGFQKDPAKLITEFCLIDLYWYYRTFGSKDRPRVIVLDEIQNLDQRLESPLGKFLTEGRKFGISLILATQTLSNFSRDEKDRLFQAAHKLFFKPAETEIKTYAQILESTTNDKAEYWIQRLSSLKKGECYSLGPVLNEHRGTIETKAIKIKIASISERFK